MFDGLYKNLIDKVQSGNRCVILTYLELHSDSNGSIAEKILLTEGDIEKKSLSLQDGIYEKLQLALGSGKLETIHTTQNKAILVEPFIPKPRLLIFGGGHVAKPLSEFAARVGFCVTVIDDRPFFANTARFPEADSVICESFEKSFGIIGFRKSDFVVIVTRGHRHDGLVLREAMKHELHYVGMIGSKRKVKAMMEELTSEGFPSDKLASVNAPIGLDIGAVTPDEIGISIVSQLISFKNKGTDGKFDKNFAYPEFDTEVAAEMSKELKVPRALLTILSSKGSVPRKSGAKMVTYLDGRNIGSIGGGCSESGVISKAREIMTSGGFLIEHIDMTGEAAESEGMVCGGTMEVLIEII